MAGLGHRQDRGVMLPPLDEIDGFMVRPGFYNSEGAVPTARGVSFTIHSVGATGCTLLLFPAAGKGAIRQTEVSGGIPHWQHVRNAGIRLED